MRARTICCVVAALVVVGASIRVPAADGPSKPFPIPELEPTVLHSVDIVRAINDGELDRAVSIIETFGHPERTGYQTESSLAKWRKETSHYYAKVVDVNPQYDSIEVVGFRRVSSGTYFLYLVAHGVHGPWLFEFRTYRFQGEWYIQGMSMGLVFQSDIESKMRSFTPLAEPVVYPLTPKRPPTKKAAEVAVDPGVNPFK